MKEGQRPCRRCTAGESTTAFDGTDRGTCRAWLTFQDEQGAGSEAVGGGRSPVSKDAGPEPDHFLNIGGILVNAAFLLVTSVMLVGQPAADKKPAPAPVPVASSCGQDCGCDAFGHKLRDRLKGMFSRDCCDTCKPTACTTHHVHTPIFKSSCDDCAPKRWTWTPKCHEPKACAPTCAPACAAPKCAAPTCSDPCERGILAKLRDRLHRDKCCDSGCSTTTVAPAPPVKSEKVGEPAKKLPVDPPKKKAATEEVRVEPQPAPFAAPASPAVPSVEIVPVPAPAPRIDGDRRDPF
jgi:hypothetical protein